MYTELIISQGLVGLQKLEANGLLPYNENMGIGRKLTLLNEKKVASQIAKCVGKLGSFECLLWLMDADYLIDYGMIGISAAYHENIGMLEKMYDQNLMCPDYILDSGNIFSERVIAYLEDVSGCRRSAYSDAAETDVWDEKYEDTYTFDRYFSYRYVD